MIINLFYQFFPCIIGKVLFSPGFILADFGILGVLPMYLIFCKVAKFKMPVSIIKPAKWAQIKMNL